MDMTKDLVARIGATLGQGGCVDRAVMPQINAEDLDAFIDFMRMRGIPVARLVVDARELRYNQRIKQSKVRAIAKKLKDVPDLNMAQPVLISSDYFVIDGNHRAAARTIMKQPVSVLQVGMTFAEVFGHVCEFPKTFEY